jgi:hypothetical protein
MPRKSTGGLSPPAAMKEFRKRARSILWRQDGKDKKVYDRFERLIQEFIKDGAMTPDQAVVEAAKDFQCLKKLFREFDVVEYDPHPESHPDTPAPEKERKSTIRNEGKELSYRENISWALTAAGEYLRKDIEPKSCPNDQAYFLFIQAKEQPKEFMQRLGQVESKGDDGREKTRLARKSSRRAAEEIDVMLAELETYESKTTEEREGSMAD